MYRHSKPCAQTTISQSLSEAGTHNLGITHKSSSLTFGLIAAHAKRLHYSRAPSTGSSSFHRPYLLIDYVQVKVSVINFIKIMDLKYLKMFDCSDAGIKKRDC